MKEVETNNKFKKIIDFGILQMHTLESFAQRATGSDIYGEGSGGGGGIFGNILLIIVGGLIVWGVIANKGFRFGVLAYAGFLGGILFIFKTFGKDAGIADCVVAMIVLWLMDPSNKDKK